MSDIKDKLLHWESEIDQKARLSDKQKDGFIDLTAVAGVRPISKSLPIDDVVSLASTSQLSGDEFIPEFKKLNLDRVELTQQFYSWFSELEDGMNGSEIAIGSTGVLREYHQHCKLMLEQLDKALEDLDHLQQKYVHVSTSTNSLHSACQHLLTQQMNLVEAADDISTRLSHFNEYDRVFSQLHSITMTVTNDAFMPLLSTIDQSLSYFQKNPKYCESSVYQMKFKHCLEQALGMVKKYVGQILNDATQQVLPKLESLSPGEDAFTLFYGKFRTNSSKVKVVVEQIEKRQENSPEYGEVLADCHQLYFNHRLTLLRPSVTAAIQDLAVKNGKDQCSLVRSGCAFVMHVCQDEFALFSQFFGTPSDHLNATLEMLCICLYDVLRPMIIHIQHLETLAELCSILQHETVCQNDEELEAFHIVRKQMLQDVQERLVYRTHIYIRSEILQYKAASGDLAYPQKLEMMQSIAESLPQEKARNEATIPEMSKSSTVLASNMPMSPADLHGMWYPTVRRTLLCLSKLFRCIDAATFQGLSQETLSMCVESLIEASKIISTQASVIDAKLFLIKHLLILREQIVPFQVEFAIKETGLDFSSIRSAAVGLYQAKSRMFQLSAGNALLQFIVDGTPQVKETLKDSKKQVDVELRKSCQSFIEHVTNSLVGKLQDFLKKCEVVTSSTNSSITLQQQPFAKPENIAQVVAVTYRELKHGKQAVEQSMRLYLANRDSEYILFKPIKTNIQQTFQTLDQLLNSQYNAEDLQLIAAPSIEQISLLLSGQS